MVEEQLEVKAAHKNIACRLGFPAGGFDTMLVGPVQNLEMDRSGISIHCMTFEPWNQVNMKVIT